MTTISERFQKLRDQYNKDSYSIGLEWEVENLIGDINDRLSYIHNTERFNSVVRGAVNQLNYYLDKLNLMLIELVNQD